MKHYPEERKQAILAKMLPPHNMSVSALSQAEGVSKQTLYTWRAQAKSRGEPVPGPITSVDDWSSEAKLAAVVETASLSEHELGEYCRRRGVYPEHIQQWKADMLAGVGGGASDRKTLDKQRRVERNEIKQLKKELRRKDKALAETTALLVLQKKFNALLEPEGEDE